MAKLNTKSTRTGVSKYTSGKTINQANGSAYKLKDKAALVTAVLTTFIKEPKYYGDNTSELIQTARDVLKTDPEFVAKLACYARNEFHMRTVSHVLAAEVAKGAKGNRIVRRMIRKIIERPDDMCNIIAYHLDTWGERKKNPIPRSLRRGFADIFGKFNEHQLAKYKGVGNKVSLKDVLCIARPIPENNEQSVLWKKLIENTLKVPETRETVLSDKGQSKETWEGLIDSGIGYMAILRNLKNMLENKISEEHLRKVLNKLKDPEQIRKSKQLPFRFYSAYKMVQNMRSVNATEVLDALTDALELSFENLPRLKGTTAIIADESGSMDSPLSNNSIISYSDIGNLFAAAAGKFCERAVTIPFGDTAKVISLSNRSSIFDNMNKMKNAKVGCSTILSKALECIDTLDEKVDRILIFSDMQAYTETWGYPCKNNCQSWVANYKKQVSNLWVHSIDLAGYGTSKIAVDNVNLIAGWSDKILDFIYQVEAGGKDLIDTINDYQI